MNQLISNIKNIPGVIGVAVFKDNGSLVAYDFPDPYDKKLLCLIGLRFQPIKEILPQHESEIVYLCWEFENVLGFYYPVTGGWVNILSSDQIPMPVFSLTMTAVSKKLPELLEGVEPAPDQAAPGAVENTVTPEAIQELETFFSLYLGPAAPVIFKRAAHQLGYTLDKIPRDNLKTLLDSIIAKVPANKKDEVVEKVTAIINQ